MADWQRKVMLNPEWVQATENEISIQQLAAVVAERLAAVADFTGDNDFLNDQRDDLIEEFKFIAESEAADRDDFNAAMATLWDWGDTPLDGHWNGRKACWIDTISQVQAA